MGLQEGAAFAECGLGSVVMAIAMLFRSSRNLTHIAAPGVLKNR